MRHLAPAIILCILSFPSFAEENPTPAVCEREGLAACKLPHGCLTLPDGKSAWDDGAKAILKLSDGKLYPADFKARGDNAPKTLVEFQERIKKTGDVLFFPKLPGRPPQGESGSWKGSQPALWVMSGQVTDLGVGFLSDFSGKALAAPEKTAAFMDDDKRKEPVPTPGVVFGLKDGHVYLLQAMDGKHALLRVVQVRTKDKSVLVEFVHQPDGSRLFSIPKGSRTQVEGLPPADAKISASAASASATDEAKQVTEAEIAKLVKQQADLIKSAGDTLRNPQADPKDKQEAARFLGQVRDPAGVSPLIESIQFRDPQAPPNAAIPAAYPCVAALIAIDKPASLAAIKAIAANEGETALAQEQLRLLVEVVRGVEGEEVAAFMLKERLASATSPEQVSLQKAVEMLDKTKSVP